MSGSNDTKVCRMCGNEKPLSDFYKSPSTADGHLSSCKPCEVERRKQYKRTGATGNAGYETEQAVIDELSRHGIFSVPGKSTVYKWVDVVAWGFISIEVKSSTLEGGSCAFNFNSQRRRGLYSDFVVLVPIANGEFSFHLFKADNPIFYLSNGRVKNLLPYIEERQRTRSDQVLTPEMMAESKDAWHLIEEFRQNSSDQIKDGSIYKILSNNERLSRIKM